LYSRYDDIRRVSLGDGVIAAEELVVETGTQSVSAIDCFVAGDRVFWTDSTEKVANPSQIHLSQLKLSSCLHLW